MYINVVGTLPWEQFVSWEHWQFCAVGTQNLIILYKCPQKVFLHSIKGSKNAFSSKSFCAIQDYYFSLILHKDFEKKLTHFDPAEQLIIFAIFLCINNHFWGKKWSIFFGQLLFIEELALRFDNYLVNFIHFCINVKIN